MFIRHLPPFRLTNSSNSRDLKKNFFIIFWLCSVFDAAHRLFSSYIEQGLLRLAMCGLLIVVASLVAEHGS